MSPSPLAELMRPQNLDEIYGQRKLTDVNGLVSKLLENADTEFFPSLIFWGPPGCGKTTVARIIAHKLERDFYEFSAVETSVKDIQKAIQTHIGSIFKAPIVFIDEIHRFNKSQQDALLPHVENGNIVLLGATTENPSFSVISPLLSRCRVVVLERLDDQALSGIIDRAINHFNTDLPKTKSYSIIPDAKQYLIQSANADARIALNVLEIALNLIKGQSLKITLKDIENALQRESLGFDKSGEEFYNTISALHKTMRGSDPDAALYYLARMLEAGQDPLYIARRVIRFASEDIGLADPKAILIAHAAFYACEKTGMPECAINLAHAVAYMAKAPKSNQIYSAYNQAARDVRMFGNLAIPKHILNAPTKLMKELGYGSGYDYSHSPEGQKKEDIEYFPDKLKGRKYL